MKLLIIPTLLLAATSGWSQETTELSEGSPYGEPVTEKVAWDLRCFPSPTSDLLIIKSSKALKHVEFYDLNGKELKPSEMPNNCYSLNDLPAGWIFLLVQSEDGFYERKSVYKN